MTKPSTDTEKYIFKLEEVTLYVPVAQLSLPVFNHINTIFAEKSVAIHFRKTEITEVSLPKNKVEYFSDNLFLADMPCRVVICLIKNDRKSGSYENPYDFRRFWDVVKLGDRSEDSSDQEKIELQRRISHLEETLSNFLDQSTSTSAKGKGKGKRPSFLSRFRAFNPQVDDEQASTSSSLTNLPEGPPPSYEASLRDGTKRIYVKKVELQLNGSSLGNLNIP